MADKTLQLTPEADDGGNTVDIIIPYAWSNFKTQQHIYRTDL